MINKIFKRRFKKILNFNEYNKFGIVGSRWIYTGIVMTKKVKIILEKF